MINQILLGIDEFFIRLNSLVIVFFHPVRITGITMRTILNTTLLTCLLLFILTNTLAAGTIISQNDVRKYNLGLGKTVFIEKCTQCHGNLGSGAPQLHSVRDWERRINTPVEILIKHAIHGHGDMPPKGGFDELTDREVSAAVAYVVDQTRRLIITREGRLALNDEAICTDTENKESCNIDQIDNTVLLELLWLLTNQTEN